MESGTVRRKAEVEEMSVRKWIQRGIPLRTCVETWSGEKGLEECQGEAPENDPKEAATNAALRQPCWVKPLSWTPVEGIEM